MPMELAFALVARLFLVVCYIILSHGCKLRLNVERAFSVQWKRRKNHGSENLVLYSSLLSASVVHP